MGNYFRQQSGYTGHLLEDDVLGKCPITVVQYKRFREAVEEARANQPAGWDPTDPHKMPANNLHAEVCKALGLEDWSELSLFCSVGTPLDCFHGVDAFFQFGGRIATLDLTTNHREAKEGHKAHFVIEVVDLEDGPRRERLAREIAEKLTEERTVVSARFGTMVA